MLRLRRPPANLRIAAAALDVGPDHRDRCLRCEVHAFLKIGTYLPYPVKLCLNGHEWVKQRLRRDRIRFDSLDNGFLSCVDAPALQAACDALGPADVQASFDR